MRRIIPILIVLAAFLAGSSTVSAQKKSAKKSDKVQTLEKTTKKPAEKKVVQKKDADAKATSDDPAVGKTKDGKPVYAGSRGGFYYLTEAGNKTYVKDFVGQKIVGKTADGLPIYEGPRGGRFYYNAKGDKIYVQKDK